MTHRALAFSVPIVPRGKERGRTRSRVIQTENGPVARSHVYTDKATVEAEGAVLREFRRRFPRLEPMTGPVMLRFTAIFPPLASFTKAQREAAVSAQAYHTAKPDKDNIEKLIVDALNGWAWVDDSQVQGGGVKRYGSPPRIDIEIQPLAQIAAMPADQRAEARLTAHRTGERPLGVKPRRTKSKTKQAKLPPHLQARVDAALTKEEKRRGR